jgi:hypothetical protein
MQNDIAADILEQFKAIVGESFGFVVESLLQTYAQY